MEIIVDENAIEKNPDLDLAQLHFALTLPDEVYKDKKGAAAKLLDAIKEKKMLPFYNSLVEQHVFKADNALIDELKASNEGELKTLDEKIKDAEENLGESEIREALLARADFYNRIGDKEKAVNAYRQTFDKTVALGQKIDVVLTLIRVGLFWKDADLTTRNIEKAKTLVEEGGDWDRRNRLKTYECVYLMSIRDFAKAAQIFLETLATFTSYELCDYRTFIRYLVLMSMVSLDRVTIKKKVIDSPDTLSVIHDIPYASQYLESFYNSDYTQFFVALAEVTEQMKTDRYLATHVRYYCREMRIKAYSQLLESYSSVKLNSMAAAFGVSADFIDHELSRFIAANRIHCKIDKVNGIVETTRPDAKNAQYQATIKQGDLLLNRIQKLSRVINL
jgi:26S proteasome regulatory subunit N7